VRERRAGKLLIGLGCILVLSLIGDVFDMPATRFIFSDFRQIGVIAIIILFQPELRSALEKVGGMPSSGIRNITADSRDASVRSAEIDALCTAVSDLSRDKVGALIVIERTTKLGEYIKSGVSVDAALTPHLLRNIFFNKAPLHDGAVIIRSGRICAAGCFLPLSTKDDINKDLGTRHRAAIGMSEISDAIVIIVSEETGTVSMSIDGNLSRNYNYSSLKQELNKLLTPQGQTEHGKKHQRKERKMNNKNDVEE
jgi:diadenylate cyclase